jgi:hypothetical protein
MMIHNLTDRERLIADLVWGCQSTEHFQQVILTLPLQQRQQAAAILQLIEMGGDDVTDVAEAAEIIDKIRTR